MFGSHMYGEIMYGGRGFAELIGRFLRAVLRFGRRKVEVSLHNRTADLVFPNRTAKLKWEGESD